MRKAHSIALAVVVALVAAAPAQADPPEARPFSTPGTAEQMVAPATTQGPGQQILRQERGRSSDPRLFHSPGSAPVQVVGPADGFDLGDAVVGGAVAAALALLAAATVVFTGSRRSRPGEAATAES
jgi:hypothetical protein